MKIIINKKEFNIPKKLTDDIDEMVNYVSTKFKKLNKTIDPELIIKTINEFIENEINNNLKIELIDEKELIYELIK